MASKKCLICSSSFSGRRDAKTCSVRCRKRLQLLKLSFEAPAKKSLAKTLSLLILGIFSALSLVLGMSPAKTSAATSSYLNFQARLLNSAGNVVPDGNYNIDFKIYDADSTTGAVGTCSGSCLWEETRKNSNSQGVRVVNGYLSVKLGEVNPFPAGINWDQELWLTMNIGGTTTGASVTWDGEMQSSGHSIQLTAVPLAFAANKLATGSGSSRGTLSFANLGQATDITLPDPGASTATVCYQNSSACGFLTGTTGVQLQTTSPGTQQTGNFNISGTGIAATSLLTPSIDQATAGALGIANSTATSVEIGNASTNITTTVTGLAVFKPSTGNDSATAFQIQDASGTALLTADTSNQKVTISGTANYSRLVLDKNSATERKSQITFSQQGTPIYALGTDINHNNTNNFWLFDSIAGQTRLFIDQSGNVGIGGNNITPGATLHVTGTGLFQSAAGNSATAFQIQNAGGSDTLFTADTSNNRVVVGNSTAAAGNDSTLFVVDSTTTANLPIGVNGGIIYDSTAGKFKIYENGAWKILCNQTDATCGGNSTTLQQAYTASTGGTTPEIKIDSTRGALDIQDADTPTGGNLLNIRASNGGGLGNILFGVGNTGATTFQNSVDSTSAFQIQNASGGSLFLVDSTNSNITVLGNNSGELQAWRTNTSAGFAAVRDDCTVTANGFIYVIGGINASGTPTNTVQYARINANGSIGNWTTTTAINVNGAKNRVDAGCTVVNGYLYVIGGSTSAASSNAQSTTYFAKINRDGTLGGWSSTISIPAPRWLITATSYNGYIYADRGDNTGGSSTDTMYYAKVNADGTVGSWATVNLGTADAGASTLVANGYIYSIGGATSSMYAKLGSNGAPGTWNSLTALPEGRDGNSSVVANGYIYVIGGDGGAAFRGTTYYGKLNSDGSVTSWNTAVQALPGGATRAWYGGHGLIANGYIYVIGGQASNAGGALSTQYYTSVTRLQVGGDLDLVGLSGDNLNESGTGGSLTAGNTNIIGTLNVRGATSLSQGLTVGDSLNVGGSALFKNSIDSTTAVQIQNATGGNLFQVDTSNSNVTILGNNSGELQAWVNNSGNPLPTARESHASVTANGYVYVFGGWNGASQVADVNYAKLNADGSVGSWGTLTSTPLPLAEYDMGATTANGYVYIVGGDDGSGNEQSTVYYAKLNADGTLGAWKTNTSTGFSARTLASVVTANGYIYALGGRDSGNNPTNTVQYAKLNADGSVGTWSTLTGFPQALMGHKTVVANGYVYVIGGQAVSAQTTIYYAKLNTNGTIGSWNTNTANPLPQARYSFGSVVVNGYVYVIGGTTNGTNAQSTVYYAPLNSDGSIGNWSTNSYALGCATSGCGSPAGRGFAGTVTANGYIYVLGGNNGSSTQSTIYYTSASRLKIGAAALDLVGLSGENLAEGGTGGELTAGNTNIIGRLSVQGAASVQQGLSVGGSFNVGGSALFKNGTDSTTAFQVQNAAGTTILGVNTSSGILFSNIADSSGAVGFTLNTTNTYSTLGARLISIQNNGSERFAIDFGGHVITGGSSPSTLVLAAAGTGATCVVNGNDTSGNIVLTAGTGATAGDQCRVNFANAFISAPHPVISPTDTNSAGVGGYIVSTTGHIDLNFNVAGTNGTIYIFNYFNPQ